MSITNDPELERFKVDINLTEYAASQGFNLDIRESSLNSAIMSKAGDKIVVARANDNHWVYFSVHNDYDNGSIIDFIQKRKNLNLGRIRQLLRPWIGMHGYKPKKVDPDHYVVDLLPISKDLAQVKAQYAATNGAIKHPYLNGIRSIPTALLSGERFVGRIRIDDRGNAIFPHFSREGITGFEIKNQGFTRFSKGGTKGLWCSRGFMNDTKLVVSETAIDALSYAALFNLTDARYVSIGGALNPLQPDFLKSAMNKLPRLSRNICS